MKRTFLRVGISLGLLTVVFVYVRSFGGFPDASRISIWGVAAIGGVLLLTVFLAALRLQYAAGDLGYPLRYRDCLAASAAGNAAGYVVFQLVGQIAARGAILRRLGVSVDTTAMATIYERFVALGVSVGLAAAGSIYLFGRIGFDLDAGGQDFLKIVISMLVVAIVVCATVWRPLIAQHIAPLLNARTAGRVARLVVVTLLIQAGTLVALVLAVHQFTAPIAIADLVAASAIVMFAAAIPISFAGWGMRELGAVAALGAIGLPAGPAVSASVLIGLMSLVTVCLVASVSLAFTFKRLPLANSASAGSSPSLSAIMAWTLPFATAMLVLFQIRVPIVGGFATLSPADLFAAVCGMILLFNVIVDKKLRRSMIPLLAFGAVSTALFVFAYVNGWLAFGSSQWATSKLIGWLVLLGYLATGLIIARHAGHAGISALALTMLTAGVTIVGIDAVTHYIGGRGRWEGLAGNPNAFAFQMIMCFVVGFSIFRQRKIWPVVAAVLAFAAFSSLSRSGVIAFATCGLLAVVFRPKSGWGLAAALLGCVALIALSSLDLVIDTGLLLGPERVLPGRADASVAFSDNERWRTIVDAWEIFTRHPIAGAGLGHYFAYATRADGSALIIHSTPLWMLAEFGLPATLTFCAFGAAALTVAVRKAWRGDDVALIFVLAATAFVLMGAAQEMLYQRSMWLVAGLAIGAVMSGRAASEKRPTNVQHTNGAASSDR